MNESTAIEAAGLTKRFGQLTVVADLDLNVQMGTVVSLLGPNGAGKTTTVRMLATLLRPDAGWARVAGYDVVRDAAEVRRRISLTGQFAALDKNLTARENLVLMARLRGRTRREAGVVADGLIERFAIAEFRNRLEEADALADRVLLIDRGREVAAGTPAQLKAQVGEQRVDVVGADAVEFERLGALLREQFEISESAEQRTVSVAAPGEAEDLARVAATVAQAGIAVDEIALRRPTLDDAFLALTGHMAHEDATPEEVPA
jgi:ABC-2 type transport system ATP-binding protein